MSGGSYNYACWTIENEYVGKMFDAEMDEFMQDLANVLHDLEWWRSCDYSEEDYRTSLADFKEKWLGKRDERLRERVVEQLYTAIDAIRKT